MKIETLKLIINAFHCASKDQTRINLNQVLVEKADANGMINIVATDGHKLSKSSVSCESTRNYLDTQSKPIAVINDALPVLKAILKQWSTSLDIPSQERNGSLVVGTGVEYALGPDAYNFPNYRAIMPKEDNYTLEVSLNAEYIIEAYKALNLEKKNKCVTLRINPTNIMAPVLLNHGEGTAVIMPMRK